MNKFKGNGIDVTWQAQYWYCSAATSVTVPVTGLTDLVKQCDFNFGFLFILTLY